jgi:Double zinc ribbon
MAGPWPFGRGRSARTAGGEAPRRASNPAALKRERRGLLREREERIRDLGGLVFEMFRRDRFRVELVTERCADLVALEKRLDELDSLLAAARRGGPRCECGAPLAWGAHFCGNCGRPVGTRPVVACARCGTPLPAGVKFCGRCGSAVELPDEPPAETQVEPSAKESAEA